MESLNITSARYVLSSIENENTAINIQVNGVMLSVPLDPSNRHYAEIMRQVEAGTLTIQEAE